MKELCFDISTWQGGIDYNEIKRRTNYCILRAGFGDYGSGIKDNQFETHYENLQGMNLGAYWYSDARNMEEAKSEAYKFLQYINGKKFTLPLFLDIEDATQRGLGKDTLNSIISAFGEVIEEAGYYFAVYTNLDWYRNVISGSELNKKFDWWIACWSDTAPTGVNYGVWQFTSDYIIDNERVDANYVYVDYPDVIRKAGLNHLEVTPTPTPIDDFKIGDKVCVKGYATESSDGSGKETAEYGGNPNDPSDIRYITDINEGASRPYHISVGNTLGDGDRGWVSKDQIRKI